MFEAVLLACLVASPDICRAQLLPGYEAKDAARCETLLREKPPSYERQSHLLYPHPPQCSESGPALPVEEVAPGVFVHMGQIAEPDGANKGDVSNLGFVIGAESVAVIDTGSARWIGEALWRAIRERTDLPVSHVILTHMHPDHVLGAGVFESTGAQVIGHDALPRALADRAANYLESLERLIGQPAFLGSDVVPVDVVVGDAMTIDLGDRELAIKAWPLAHTSTDITVMDAATGTLFTGDLVFHLHTPALDGSLRGWQAALDALSSMDVARVIPGHGGPVLDWPEGGADLRRYLQVLSRDTRAAIDAGQRLGAAVETIAQSEAQHWSLFEAYNPRNATVAFTELEWE